MEVANTDYEAKFEHQGVHLKLWRGEGMGLLAFDLDEGRLDNSFVGFAIQYQPPGANRWYDLNNRLHFDYEGPRAHQKWFPTSEAPIQKFRWLHVPRDVRKGEYTYRVTPMYMDHADSPLRKGPTVEGGISLESQTIEGFLNVGFTRGFASSQAYADKFANNADILPAEKGAELEFDTSTCQEEYEWLGFEARRLLFSFLDACINDSTVTVEAMVYELREPDFLRRLEQLGPRVRALIDDHDENGDSDSPESKGAARLYHTAGLHNVKRTHFSRQQHNKVLIAKRNGNPIRVFTGSTNFSLRGLYIQANNALVFDDENVARLYSDVFNSYWLDPSAFRDSDLEASWHVRRDLPGSRYSFCFSPHRRAAASLTAVADSIRNARSSVLYAVFVLNQISGPVRQQLDRLMHRSLFSYGLAQRQGQLEVKKPDGSRGLVSFAYLAGKVPQPFSREWSGGEGNVMHHKFVVVDFNGANPKVFTGSSNLAAGGEEENGDNLICIEDRRVSIPYAIEALRLFDHYHFRVSMRETDDRREKLTLRKPPQHGESPWWADYFEDGHAKQRDRHLFTS